MARWTRIIALSRHPAGNISLVGHAVRAAVRAYDRELGDRRSLVDLAEINARVAVAIFYVSGVPQSFHLSHRLNCTPSRPSRKFDKMEAPLRQEPGEEPYPSTPALFRHRAGD